MRVKIKDIAQKTGLSITTVSLVLNGKADKISEKTKELIFQTVKELNYHPNQIAVGLVKKRTNTLGLIIPDISNMFFSEIAKGVEDEGRKDNYNVILCNTNDKHEIELEYINILAAKGVDGVILDMSAEDSEEKARESLDTLLDYGIPTVIVDRFTDDKSVASISIDNRQGAFLATQHLIDLGHKRIGCVTGPVNEKTCIDRYKGYCEALKKNGISVDKSLTYEGDYHLQSGCDSVKTMLSKKVTAIFAFNDMMAYGVARALRENSIKLPDEMSIVGFDDIFLSEIFDIPLTTVRQPTFEMGKEAARMLIQKIKHEKEICSSIVLEPELKVRKSTKHILSEESHV